MESRAKLNPLVMVDLLEKLYQTNEISEEVKLLLIAKFYE